MPCGYVRYVDSGRASAGYGLIAYILREASASLLVLLIRAMRRPQGVERATGMALTHFRFLNRRLESNGRRKEMEEKLKSHFLSLYCMIVADGDVAISELDELYRIAREHYGFTQEEIDQAVLSGGSSFYVPEQDEEKIKYLYDLALIAAADGVDESEVVLLKNYALKFGFLDENIEELVDLLLDFAKKKTSVEELINLTK